METILVIVCGLIIGSFLNVVIHRLPLKQSLIRPSSHCPRCLTPIPFYLNVPVLSYLWLRGRCRFCRQPISPRYPLVELFTAFTFWLGFSFFGLTPHAAATVLFLCLLIALALIDLEHMILPDELTLSGAFVFAIYAFFHPQISPLNAFLSAFAAVSIFTALYFFYLKVRKIEGLGFGDVKMMAFMGLFLGYEKLAVAVLLASLAGTCAGLFFVFFRKKSMTFALPFGSFLSLGGYVAAFWGPDILRLIASFTHPQR